MPVWKEGDRVKIVTRKVTDDDRKKSRYFDHMSGLSGVVQNVYADGDVAVRVDEASLNTVCLDVHRSSIIRLRQKFLTSVSEEQRKALTKEEIEFDAHYVLLVANEDLEGVA